jgi:hypothetical protein
LNVHRKGLDSKENRWYHRWDRDKKSVTESGTPYQSDDAIINAYEPFENDNIIHYPNFQSGSLSIKSEIEFPHSFRCLENLSTERLEPYYYTDDNNDIWVIIPGIEYVVNGPLWVDKIIITALNDGVELPLYTANINSPHS